MRYARAFLAAGLFLSWAASDLQAQSFSLDTISPSVQLGNALGDDVLAVQVGAVAPVLPAPLLGYPGVGFEVDAFSFGRPANQFSVGAPAFFSVDIGNSAVPGTAAANEFNNGLGSEDSSDVFFSSYNSNNSLALDGDGNGSFPNPNVPGLGVAEPASFPPQVPILPSGVGDVDALDMRSTVLPANSPTGATYFSIDPITAASGVYGGGISPGDVFVGLGTGGYDLATLPNLPPASPGGVAQPYASEFGLGFMGPIFGNDIDALVVFDDGDNSYTPGTDVIIFSLTPGSPYIGTLDPGGSGLTISPGDILVDGMTSQALFGPLAIQPSILHTAESLGLHTIRSGLAASDGNLNALDIVPEPSTFVMAGFAALALVGYGWRRRKMPT